MDKLLIKRGSKRALEQLDPLQVGELFLAKDEERLYVGGPKGNIPIATQKEVDEKHQEVVTQLEQTKQQIDSRGVSVLDYGAVGDGITDDTQAIQEALDNHTHVYFPAGHTFLVSGLISSKGGARLVGGGSGNTTIKQTIEARNTPIIHLKGENSLVSDLKIEGEWGVIHDNNPGVKFDKSGIAQNLHLQYINGDGINFVSDSSKATNIRLYNINGYGIIVRADSQLSNIEAGRTKRAAIRILGGHNTITNAFVWMSGSLSESGRDLINYEDGHGIVVSSRGNTLAGVTVMASTMHGIVGDNIQNTFISGTSKHNGRRNNWNSGFAGFKGRNVQGSTILLNASNDLDKWADDPSNTAWGWQKHALLLENFGAIYGNVFNVSAMNVDSPIVVDSRDWIQLRNRNSVSLADGNNHIIVSELPTARAELLGQILLLKGDSTPDTLHVCMQRSTGQYVWVEIGSTD